MRIGTLRHRITIQSRTDTQDDFGAPVYSWTTFLADVPADVVPVTGKEYLAAGSTSAQVVAKATIRYAAGILPTMRVIHDGATYVIQAVLPDATARKSITLMLEQGVSNV